MEKSGSGRPRTALNESVKVVVRCRPLSEKERNEDFDEVVKVWPERGSVQVLNPKGQDKVFTYDAAYDHAAHTQTIYDEMVRPLVASVLDGFNGCVFAYGQTGTGKTHTMEGGEGDLGIIPRAFRHIWTHIETTASSDVTHLVSCSYVELYLEDIRDLLSKECKKLTIRGQELNGFYIPEMTSIVCKSAAEMERVMRTGNRVRAAGRTDMNEHSSRSHAVFLVTVESAHKKDNRIRVGKLNLVDLAGSERARKTNAGGERLKEAARINQALSSLGNVISALAEASPHVPYRDSKLTRILQDSLGGNSKTIMIATIGPACYNYDETVTTLRYAHRAKAIKNKPIRNEDPKDAKLREYQAEIERLRLLIEQRKADARARAAAASDRERRSRKQPRLRPAAPAAPPDNCEAADEDTASLESEHILAESTIELEKRQTEELEHQIKALEERLVTGGAGGGGGKDLINNLNESQMILEQRNSEIAERKKREVEMQQKIDLEEETTAIVTNTFTTLQQEVDHKTQRLKKCLQKYTCLREEMVELREAHDAERREQEAQQAALIGELRRRLLLCDGFVPHAGRAAVLRLRYNDDTDAWELPKHCSADPLISRPVASGGRRPMCVGGAARDPRHRAENLLDLQPMPLPATTRAHLPPPATPAPPAHGRQARQAEAPVKKEPDIEARSARRVRPSRPSTAHHRLGTAAAGR